MKKILICLLFISIVLGLTLFNVTLRKDTAKVDIKIKNIEALAADENGDEDPCNAVGAICFYYDKDQNPVICPGLTIEI